MANFLTQVNEEEVNWLFTILKNEFSPNQFIQYLYTLIQNEILFQECANYSLLINIIEKKNYFSKHDIEVLNFFVKIKRGQLSTIEEDAFHLFLKNTASLDPFKKLIVWLEEEINFLIKDSEYYTIKILFLFKKEFIKVLGPLLFENKSILSFQLKTLLEYTIINRQFDLLFKLAIKHLGLVEVSSMNLAQENDQDKIIHFLITKKSKENKNETQHYTIKRLPKQILENHGEKITFTKAQHTERSLKQSFIGQSIRYYDEYRQKDFFQEQGDDWVYFYIDSKQYLFAALILSKKIMTLKKEQLKNPKDQNLLEKIEFLRDLLRECLVHENKLVYSEMEKNESSK